MRLAAFIAGLLCVGVTSADAPPDPGTKQVPIQATVTFHTAIQDYDLYARPCRGALQKLSVVPGEPTPIPTEGGRRDVELFAVPKSVSKRYLQTKELAADLDKAKLPDGVARFDLSLRATLPNAEKRTVIRGGYLIKPGQDNAPPVIEKLPPEPSMEKEPSASLPRLAVAGLALALAVVSAGIVFSRRVAR